MIAISGFIGKATWTTCGTASNTTDEYNTTDSGQEFLIVIHDYQASGGTGIPPDKPREPVSTNIQPPLTSNRCSRGLRPIATQFQLRDAGYAGTIWGNPGFSSLDAVIGCR